MNPAEEEEEEESDRCPKCGSDEFYVQREGISGILGRVRCSKCHADIREWNAY